MYFYFVVLGEIHFDYVVLAAIQFPFVVLATIHFVSIVLAAAIHFFFCSTSHNINILIGVGINE